MSKKPKKMKWTEQMNIDVLECKRKAQELTTLNNAPCNNNGRKKGYIEVMNELWNEKGYGHLGLKRQNLRDQASRLEKTQRNSTDMNVNVMRTIDTNESISDRIQPMSNIVNNMTSTEDIDENRNRNQNNIQQQSQNDNHPIQGLYLHTSAVQLPGESLVLERDHSTSENALDDVPGNLPEYKANNAPSTFIWGRHSDGRTTTVSTSTIDNVYNEITKWRKNAFLVPYGKTGKNFIDKLTKHINDWNNRSEMQHCALKAAIVLLALCLQKPSKKSKAKEHKECLAKRLALWEEGEIDILLREGRMIQRRLTSSRRTDPPDKAKVFANLVMKGQIHSALRYLSDNDGGGVLPLSDDVMRQLREKHPTAQEAHPGSLLFGPIENVPDVIFLQINGEMVRDAALRTKGSGGPSGVDADGFRRMLACKSFKKSGTDLCAAIATMARRLCTELIDPRSIEVILANRLIPLDKGEGAVRPIGVGEVIRRIIGKCVMRVTKPDVVDASGSLQVCAGLKSGSEAAIHAMRKVFDADETDAVLLIDASNAFNALNRAAALHNTRVLCPAIATYAINTYRQPARLFVTGGEELRSVEGTTQGDPIAMSLYAISLQPLITLLHISSKAKQCWFADDATGSGSLKDVKKWWDELSENGPALGYFPNAKKCWLVVKPEKEDAARVVFCETAINITTEGYKHLGAALGSRSYLEEYVGEKVEDWVNQVTKLAEFATSQPQASYAAFTFGLRHRWTYFVRTLPDITDLLEPLEHAITDVLIPAITGDHVVTEVERDLLALPVRMGGLGLQIQRKLHPLNTRLLSMSQPPW